MARQRIVGVPFADVHPLYVTGVVCGHRVEEVDDPLMQQIRWRDKLVDEVARGKRMSSIPRGSAPSAAPPARTGG